MCKGTIDATREYIENTLDSINDLDAITENGISQAGLLASYQLTPKWSASGQYFYDPNYQ